MQIKRPLKRLKKAHLEEHILETFILVLMESNVEVMSVKISSYLCSYFWGGSSEMQRVITLIS